MQLAVATHSRLLVVELDDSWRVSNLRTLARGHHYGLGLRHADGWLVSKHNDRELTYYHLDGDQQAGFVEAIGGKAHYIHQIACVESGIYVTNTGYNSIVFRSHDGALWDEHFIDHQRTDVNHINSVFPCGDRLLVLLHNRGVRPSQVLLMQHTPGRGFVRERTMSVAHMGCHNIFYDGRTLYYNASSVGKFLGVSAERNRIVHDLAFPGHAKGLSVTQRHLIVGYSDHTTRDLRHTSRGHLAVLDRADLSVKATVDLNVHGPVGNVNEIRCLSEPELGQAGPQGLLETMPVVALRSSEGKAARARRLISKLKVRLRIEGP